MKNYIGLDISKVSTAMVIKTNDDYFVFSYNNKKLTYKWNKLISEKVNIKHYEYLSDDDYSISEIYKLKTFLNIANDITKDILNTINININNETVIFIEGYSYSKDAGPIIDLVGIGSIIRGKIYEMVPNIKQMKIIAPKSLKSQTCEKVYGFEMVDKGKRKPKIVKEINTNKEGVRGGDFTKTDMFKAIMDLNVDWSLMDIYKDMYDDLISLKTFPKPLEDINDAFLLLQII